MRLYSFAAVAALLAATPLPGPEPDDGALAIGFLCGAERAQPAGEKRLVRVDGMGAGGYPVAARNPEAQAWVDYGFKLAHAFYHADSKAAFAKAVELEPDCAMCLWAEAWVLTGNLNFPPTAEELKKAAPLLAKAESLSAGLVEKDRALIAALKPRLKGRAAGALPFAKAMDALAVRYPEDDAIAILASEAWMIAASDNDLKKPERAAVLAEGVLKRHPDHTGAIHFYIHATEWAGRPADALPYAEKLAALAPSASHLAHMPAHTLIRVGRYQQVAVENARALAVDAAYAAEIRQPGPPGERFYYGHNLGFGIAGAMMSGDAALALKLADHTPRAFPPSSPAGLREGIMADSYVVYGRYAPDRALALPEPGKGEHWLRLARHYARGEALASRGNAAAVRVEAKAIAAIEGEKDMREIQKLSRLVLEGRAAMLENRPAEAAKRFAEAAALQDKAFGWFMDPPPWWYPVRRSQAAAELKAGRPEAAAKTAEASLKKWPNDALALKVLAEAEAALGRKDAADKRLAEARKAWRGELSAMKLDLI